MRRSAANPLTYVESLVRGMGAGPSYDDLRSFILFVGHPRSGTSLVGSLLNAHPEVVLAHELNALKYVRFGYRRNQLLWLLEKRDEGFARSGRAWTGYDYEVPGGWQGRYETLRVIGDKKAARTSDQLMRRPGLIDRLEDRVGLPVKMIQVARHPMDVIVTLARRHQVSLDEAADIFERRSRTLEALHQARGSDLRSVGLERLTKNPAGELRALCAYLGVDAPEPYLEACASIVFDRPKTSREREAWTTAMLDRVARLVDTYPLLHGYEVPGTTQG